jgi:hypothetical protein
VKNQRSRGKNQRKNGKNQREKIQRNIVRILGKISVKDPPSIRNNLYFKGV